MKLTLLHIISFGGLTNYEIRLDDGVNVLYGANESGKSSAAMFIKFMFYGLSAKAPRGADLSERDRYVHRLSGQATGYILLETDDGTEYRIERAILTSDDGPARERVRIINRATGETLTGQNPGEYFFGVGEEVFLNTCFVGQVPGSGPRPRVQALENLLTSADETVDVQKAIRTLDGVRREICHKNGTGGELNDLRERRAALADEIRNTAGTSADILRVSTSLNDIKKRIRELEDDRQTCESMFQALDKIMLRRRIETAEQIESNIAALRDTIAELDASVLGSGFTETLDEAERDIRSYADTCAAYAASPDSADAFPDDLPVEADETADSPEFTERTVVPTADTNPVETALRFDNNAHTQFTAAVALFLAGLFGFAASLLMYYFNTDMYLLPLLMTLAFVTLGVIFILLHARSSTALTRLLTEWNVNSIDELEQLFAEPDGLISDEDSVLSEPEIPEESAESGPVPEETPDDSLPEPLEELEPLPEELPDDRPEIPQTILRPAQERFEAAVAKVKELCKAADIEESDNICDTLSALRRASDDIRADRETMTAKLSNLSGKLEVLNEQLLGVDRLQAEYDYQETLKQPHGKTAAALNADEIKTLMRERDFTVSALSSAEKRRTDLETQLAALGSPAHTPDEAATALDELDRRIEELSLRHDACELAKNALLTACDHMRSGVIPKIAANASILLSGATSGTHETLTLDGSLNAGCSTADDILSGDYLSRGTSDLAYIALRIALAEEIFRTELPFMLFDESFSHIDASRIRGIVSLLIDGQHLLFTCRREEAEAAAAGGAAILEMN